MDETTSTTTGTMRIVLDLDGTPVRIKVLDVRGATALVQDMTHPKDGNFWVQLAALRDNRIDMLPLSQWPADRA
jgi:hypothetical protein